MPYLNGTITVMSTAIPGATISLEQVTIYTRNGQPSGELLARFALRDSTGNILGYADVPPSDAIYAAFAAAALPTFLAELLGRGPLPISFSNGATVDLATCTVNSGAVPVPAPPTPSLTP